MAAGSPMDLEKLLQVAVPALIGAAGTLVLWMVREYLKARRAKRTHLLDVPRDTLRLHQPPRPINFYWYLDSVSGAAGMQIRGYLHVTNVSTLPVTLLAAKLKRIYSIRVVTSGSVNVMPLVP